jgi:hypothetical protein
MSGVTKGELPRFRISLEERKSPHSLERHPRYAVLVNGEQRGELYYNMRGYQGYLPTVQGSQMDIGERGISAFRKEVRVLNREAEDAIERGASDPRRVVLTRPTEDRRVVFALSRHAETGEEGLHLLSRTELLQAERLFGRADVGVGFFSLHGLDPAAAPAILVREGDEELVGKTGRLPVRGMTALEEEHHDRAIERVIRTEDPDTLIVITRRTRDGADPEPEFVSKWGYDIASARYGGGTRLSDLERVDSRPAVPDAEDRAYLRANFTWLEVAEPESSEPDQVAGPA